MADLETIRKRLEKYILEKDHTFREVSLKIGRKDSYIQQYIKYGFPKRLNEMDRKKICQLLNIKEELLLDDELINSRLPQTMGYEDEEIQGNKTEFIRININQPDSSGNLDKNVIGRMTLNYIEFSNWISGNPFNLRIIRLDGDYMEPTLMNGSLIIYDMDKSEYNGDGIYVIRLGTTIQIKRLQKTSAEMYALKSDNPRYQDINCASKDLEIIGRAIYQLSGRPL